MQDKYPEYSTYCDFFNNCLETLDAYLNETSEIHVVRRLFSLDEHLISDDDLAFYIQHFTQYLLAYLPEDEEIDTESPKFKQALYTQIACHIFRINPTAIVSPKSYKVDEVRETFVLDFDKNKNTWCDIANEDFANLKKKSYGLYGLYAYDRPGARTKYGHHNITEEWEDIQELHGVIQHRQDDEADIQGRESSLTYHGLFTPDFELETDKLNNYRVKFVRDYETLYLFIKQYDANNYLRGRQSHITLVMDEDRKYFGRQE